MTIMYLLDINILIALGDPLHVHTVRAHRWFSSIAGEAWATCPLVQNGFLRILGNASYHKSPGPPHVVNRLLRQICSRPGHQFWPDSITLCDYSPLPAANHLTDFYLLALAIHHTGKLATLDQRIDPSLLPGGEEAYCVIP
jgi:toxin-antitoxin system PIN domain toxin